MSFFNRMLASIGIGAAQVDTLLDKQRYAIGEEVRGIVKLRGGNVDQHINTIYISVMTQYAKEIDDRKVYNTGEVGRFLVTDPFTLAAGEVKEIPFSFLLPSGTPLSVGRTPIWLKTGLDISSSVDPTDDDRIEVSPSAEMRTVLDAVSELGFQLRKADCEYAPRLGYGAFAQELEYYPVSGPFRGKLDELEVIFVPNRSGGPLEVLLQIDRRVRGLASLFSEAMDLDESFVRVRLDAALLSGGARAVAGELESVIRRYA
ncbi:sporulation protein [Paenibacillus thermotolerans]|uniref:sporulation protein n=1 Tax=Paenibacillus thermotolerans TaxID=3027807 RepID=UPI00236847FD|nr:MULTISPECIES: sporulation protein [unclassified Paenibacillus]